MESTFLDWGTLRDSFWKQLYEEGIDTYKVGEMGLVAQLSNIFKKNNRLRVKLYLGRRMWRLPKLGKETGKIPSYCNSRSRQEEVFF